MEKSKPSLETRQKKAGRGEITIYGPGKPNSSHALASSSPDSTSSLQRHWAECSIPCLGKEEEVMDFFPSEQSSRGSNCSLHISILSESRLNGEVKRNES